MHEYIIGILNLHIPEFYITAIPESFLRMRYLHILQGDAVHHSEHLGSLD